MFVIKTNLTSILQILFASCLDQNVYKDLKLKQGKVVSILLKLGNLIIMYVVLSGGWNLGVSQDFTYKTPIISPAGTFLVQLYLPNMHPLPLAPEDYLAKKDSTENLLYHSRSSALRW